MCELALRLTPAERIALRSTGGRHSISGSLGVPLCLLWTRGARTGRWRSVPVICTRHGDSYLVLGSNGGRPRHPQWTTNLLRDTRAAITVGGTTAPVRARHVTGDEHAALWPSALETWPPYRTYTRRSGRELRMFHLSPTTGGPLARSSTPRTIGEAADHSGGR
ncbi:deazaflavin-dependent oxidoreductase (nitroreductase family) [Actinopolyspora biskrensis]|uniref:Deazaflavin-dependent oxidoreductase (Nitroreductase family) n=1 Tax=Actinopolyspora biskrensis TaxID=1470178 RepID=A0A852Z113_9ACTN|nr:deazaflavin-dependent oxidoreductase (nitroreductase family) [Actinopolyspora biskrensis]